MLFKKYVIKRRLD